jgi:hypothetical protein
VTVCGHYDSSQFLEVCSMSAKSLLSLLVLAVSPVLSAHAACEVSALIGSARVGERALKVGSSVKPGDEVQTGADSRLRLKCQDGSSLVMAAGSRLRIDSFEMNGGQRAEARFQLSLGLIGQKVAGGGGWSVRTPSAVTAVRGTEFTVEVAGDQATAVLMQSGKVDVRPATAQSRSLVAVLPLVALAGAVGTECRDGKCSVAAPWSEARIKATLDRLSGV